MPQIQKILRVLATLYPPRSLQAYHTKICVKRMNTNKTWREESQDHIKEYDKQYQQEKKKETAQRNAFFVFVSRHRISFCPK